MENMSIEIFVDTMKTALEARFPECEVLIQNPVKNNGMKLHSLCVKKPDENLAPVFHLDWYYQCYCEGEGSIAEYLDDITEMYEKSLENMIASQWFTNPNLSWKEAKPFIEARVCNLDKNQEVLSNTVYEQLGDIAISFRLSKPISDDRIGSMPILRDVFEKWGITTEELFEAAKKNFVDNKAVETKTVTRAMYEMYLDAPECPEKERALSDISAVLAWEASNPTMPHMRVVRTVDDEFGSSAIFLMDKRAIATELGCDGFYIIPSTIYECIIFPDAGQEVNYVEELIDEVNNTIAHPGEVLSNNLYYYDATTDEIRVA